MARLTSSQTAFRSLLYGGATMLLALELFLLVKALFAGNFVPIVPIVAAMLTAAGLLFIVYAEFNARQEDKRDHRRISRVAHQLESPLHGLQENLEQLMADADALPAEARLKLKRMETKTTVLLENVRDVFLMLRAQEEGIAGEMRSYNACTVVGDVIEKHEVQAKARNVEITHTNHCERAPVKIDRSLFQIALGHVIENAMTYTMKPGLVNIAVIRGRGVCRIVVQDRGIGLSESDTRVVWQPYARGERASEFDSDGIGVGLTLARHIIREFGGDIRWRTSAKGSGSEFEIQLPLAST